MKQQKWFPGSREATFATYMQSAKKPRAGCSFWSCLLLLPGLLAGLLIGAVGTLLYISSIHDTPVPAAQSVPSAAAIVVQLSPTYLSQLATKEASQANVPGTLTNIRVTMAHNAPVTISGNDQISFMGIAVTRPVTMQMQPVIHACRLQVSITHADFSGIPLTSFVSSFEQQVDQELANNADDSLLPKGFVYCVTNVHTEANGVFVTYSARPMQG
jgi:hypothetical protein